MKKFGRTGSAFATVIVAAVVLAIVSTTGAVAGSLITSKRIKNETIKSIDVRNNNLQGVDLRDGTVTGTDVANGSLTQGDLTKNAVGLVRGYAWVDEESTTLDTPVQLANDYLYNSAGGPVTVTRWDPGVYTVTFTGLDFSPGNVQLTTYGSGSAFCTVTEWESNDVDVRCNSTSADTAIDSRFSVAVIE